MRHASAAGVALPCPGCPSSPCPYCPWSAMMSPRSFLLASRQHPPTPSSTRSRSRSSSSTSVASPPDYSSSPLSPTSSAIFNLDLAKRDFAAATAATIHPIQWAPKYDEGSKPPAVTITVSQARPISDATMGKRKERQETRCLSLSPPTTTTSLTTRPTTPTSPVKIPTNNKPGFEHPQKRHSSQRRRREVISPDALSPSLAALLAVTDIPRPRQLQRRRRRIEKTMTVAEIIDNQQNSEKELSWNLSRSPLEVLLSPPEDIIITDDDSVSECNIGCSLSTRTMSIDSIPSLGDSFASDTLSSLDTPRTPSPFRGRRFSPMRKSLEPVFSPPGSIDEHPLAGETMDVDELDFRVFQHEEEPPAKSQTSQPFKPFKSAFKSNLTASLRALRSAAKSFSGISFPSIPPDDFLTRSILTIDPSVPFTDERRPPVTEDIPSAAMRRYLNPTSNARIEETPSKVVAGTFGASIQMRTYKIQRLRSSSPSSRSQYPSTSLQPTPAPQPEQPQAASQTPLASCPGMRQREMRENPDFIRIAVMEMAMRKRGKLDDQRPGRAKWALPPRKMSTKTYEITPDGIPARWVSITC